MPDSSPAAAETFFVTTPIYYVNARPHIGHSYTTIVADVVARRHRLLGHDTFFLTGTDEHGQKIERSAAAAGIPPQQFANTVSQSFRDLWHRMGITYTGSPAAPPLPGLPTFDRPEAGFIRTTDPDHIRGVQRLFGQLRNNDAIYKGTYTGQYCVSDEAYVDGPPGIHCPDCGRPTETVSEENFYFRLSRFQLPLLNLIESNTLRIEPDSRRNEVLSFLKGDVGTILNRYYDKQTFEDQSLETLPHGKAFGANHDGDTALRRALQEGELAHTAAGTPFVPGALKDLSISRTSFSWGIPVPGDEKHVIYVWLDALANYMTAIGYGSSNPADQALFERFWPADLHLVGKEIIRFHCVYWPAFLLALDPNWATHAGAPHLDSEMWVPTTPLPSSSRPEGSAAIRSGETPVSAPAQSQGAPSLAQRGMGGIASPQPATTLGFNPAWVSQWLPRSVVAHGWLLFEESKMSKSRGNIVRTETILAAFGDQYLQGIRDHNARELRKDPAFTPVAEPSSHDRDLFATDVLRYFLLREIPFGQDGSFSFDSMVTRYNADLANGYGNLVSRVLNMLSMFSASEVPAISGFDSAFLKAWKEVFPIREEAEAHEFSSLLKLRATQIGLVDSLLTHWQPWKLAKKEDSESQSILQETLYGAADAIRILTALLYPILPFSTARVWAQLGLGSIEEASARGDLRNLQWGGLQPGTRLGPLAPIFPRADISPDKGLARLMANLEQNTRPANLQNVANDEHDSTSTGQTSFHEAPLASVAPPATDTAAVAEAQSEVLAHAQPAAPSPAAPPVPQSGMGGNLQPEGTPSTPQSGIGANAAAPETSDPATLTSRPPNRAAVLHAAPSPLSNSTTSPAAPPRTSSALVEAEPILHVGASSAPVPELPRTPSHVAAEPSGVFASATAGTPVTASPSDSSPQITIDDFAKVELRVAEILSVERIPKADKLLRIQVDLGHEHRQILSGIAEWYTPEELVGRRIIVVTNLAPRKMRGLDSHGMLLAASGPADPTNPQSAKPILATVPDPIPLGTRLK